MMVPFCYLGSATKAASSAGLQAANPGLNRLLGAVIFPVGICLVTLCGAELYTGNTSFVSLRLPGNRLGAQEGESWQQAPRHSAECVD